MKSSRGVPLSSLQAPLASLAAILWCQQRNSEQTYPSLALPCIPLRLLCLLHVLAAFISSATRPLDPLCCFVVKQQCRQAALSCRPLAVLIYSCFTTSIAFLEGLSTYCFCVFRYFADRSSFLNLISNVDHQSVKHRCIIAVSE